tara:strand:- start:33 stop:743 length:711 start_codon:yes stop_codon:yes gene_type:complete
MSRTEEVLNELSTAIQSTDLNTHAQRKLSKKGFTFSDLPVNEQILIWDKVWKSSPSFWHKVQAFFYCESLLKRPDKLKLIWPIIKEWQGYVHDWGSCDCLSKIYSKVLEEKEKLVLPTLKEWNHSDDPWKRRQSIVSLLYYHSVRKKFLPYEVMIEMVHNLVDDPDYYVQKGIGWTLRELYRTYPQKTLAYFYENADKLSSTSFSTFSKVLNKVDKDKMISLRKKTKKTSHNKSDR